MVKICWKKDITGYIFSERVTNILFCEKALLWAYTKQFDYGKLSIKMYI